MAVRVVRRVFTTRRPCHLLCFASSRWVAPCHQCEPRRSTHHARGVSSRENCGFRTQLVHMWRGCFGFGLHGRRALGPVEGPVASKGGRHGSFSHEQPSTCFGEKDRACAHTYRSSGWMMTIFGFEVGKARVATGLAVLADCVVSDGHQL